MVVLPMFPLGTVLLPSVLLPLHVFEPRYRQLTRDCLAGDRQFGVTLIQRGSEVGGGDTRTTVGTAARIIDAAELPDGRWAVQAVGFRRVRVLHWLEDDPYPRAEIEPWDDPEPHPTVFGELDSVVAVLRRVLARRSELGEPAPPATVELSEDPVLASYQAVAVSGFGPADQYALLAAPTVGDRLARLAELLTEVEDTLHHQLLFADDWDVGFEAAGGHDERGGDQGGITPIGPDDDGFEIDPGDDDGPGPGPAR